MASVSDIAPLNTTVDTGASEAQAEITKLAETIKKNATLGLKSAAQTVVGSVPKMITDLTKEIQSGPINSFGLAMNKLVTLVDKLGINLRQYNEELADTVDEYRGSQEKLQQKLHELREEGIKAEINDRGDGVRYLTNLEVKKYEKEREISKQSIETNKEEIQERLETINSLEKQNLLTAGNRKELQQEIDTRDKANESLQEEIDVVDKKIGKTADTGALSDQPGFGKLAELKEAFMVIPDTITEVFGGVKNIGKVIGKQFKGFLSKPMKTIARVFKSIGTMFRTFRILIALKVLAVIAAFQWVVEHITGIGDVFKNIWDKITGFFKKIIDWFKNSKVGKFFGLGDDDKEEKKVDKGDESRAELKQLYIEKHGEEEGTKMYNTWEAEQDADKPKIIRKGRARKFETKKVDIVPQESDQDMEVTKKSTQRTRGGGKKFIKKKIVTGDSTIDGATAQELKDLEVESKKHLNAVVQVNNNSTISSKNSQGTTVSGYVDHEPDTSFKYIRNNNSDNTWV